MSAPPLVGKTALVTGGTGGIGLETALGLAKLGAAVTVVGRDEARGREAVERIRCQSGNPDVELMTADLSSLDEVRALAERIAAAHERLDLLVNNAAGLYAERRETMDGMEATLAMTHLSPALLTHLLLPLLRRSAPARIVNVSSGAHRWVRPRWDDLQSARGYRGLEAYGRAKLLNLLWTNELARRLRGTGITVIAADPGMAATEMSGAIVPEMLPASLRLAWPLLRRMGRRRTAEAAARSSVVAATSRDVQGGALLDPRGKAVEWSRTARDGELALRAWEVTAELLGLEAEHFAGSRSRTRRTEEEPRFTAPRLVVAGAAA
ncbi:SDR family NAD(P)-dependent oxidoreductase [Longimicrobium sp.]|uniref:SDR family NAD(P)-dependent oxidoreductase n=1 Tax=Longimicrobium sp. TaxID=2029185 RepID=UPI002E33D44F|nr:SDR family NAD(P)-dependent oxidoreductase [Longimicrobium sp.]HEX6042781.1 SDR family NAD(P)-dependent oxidoreductase [Longimicrobium sp.]